MKKTVQRGRFVAAVALATALSTPSLAAEEIKIGALIPLTGSLQELAPPILNGAKLAVQEANAAGGVLNKQVSVVVKDTQLNPQVAIDGAQKLVFVDRAVASVGPLASGIVAAVATSVTVNAKHPIISPSATAPTITTLPDNGYVFRTMASDAYQGVALAKLMLEKGTDKAAIIYVNNDYGKGLSESLHKAFTDNGGAVTGISGYEEKAASYRSELDALAKGGADTLVVIGYPDNGGVNIVKQALENGFFTHFVFTDGMKSDNLISSIGAQYLEGAYGTAAKGLDTPASRSFDAAYTKAFGAKPSGPFINNDYDAMMILLLAIEEARSTDGEKIRDAITKVANAPGVVVGPGEFAKAKSLIQSGVDINYEGAAGTQDFDQNGDVTSTFEHWEVQGDKIQSVKVF